MNVSQFSLDRVSASAKLYVYLAGTATNATYYTDADGTTTGTNPQNADANGLFAPVYLDPSINYRIKVTDSAGSTTLYDIDPVRVLDEGTADGVLVVRSVDAAKKRTISATVGAVQCEGRANKGDRGQALYTRVASQPSHAGKFQSADGAWWELAENSLNPFMFGAKGDNSTNDSAAIQAMFDFVTAKAKPYPMQFLGAKYYVASALLLPKVPVFITIEIDGGGATLRSDQAITILSCPVPATQSAADVAIGQNAFDIHHLAFEGDGVTAGQIGLHLLATYTSVIRSCYFATLDYGSIGTFCLASAWRDNRYHGCKVRGAVIQSGDSYITGSPVWTGATASGSASNVSVFENCRVFGHPSQESAFGIYGSDAVRMNGCISEGAGAKVDVHYDYQGATTVKQFSIHTFHCEAPNGKLNFKIRATGQVVIDTVVLQYPAAIYDAKGSVNCEVIIRGINYLGNPPAPNGNPYNATTNPNPNGRWFYHGNGNGYGAATEGTNSAGVDFRFENCFGSAYVYFSDPAKWEGATLPAVVHVRGLLAADNGMHEWCSSGISFGTPIGLADGSNISGMMVGNVYATTASVPANSSVTETFTATGLRALKHTLFVNPYNTAYVPPNGIIWQAWLDADDSFHIRWTNVTGSSIPFFLTTIGGTPVHVWRFCAPRSY